MWIGERKTLSHCTSHHCVNKEPDDWEQGCVEEEEDQRLPECRLFHGFLSFSCGFHRVSTVCHGSLRLSTLFEFMWRSGFFQG